MHVPASSQLGLSSGFSVVVVVVVVVVGVGSGWRNGGGLRGGGFFPPPPPLKMLPSPKAGARTGRREVATEAMSAPPPPPPPPELVEGEGGVLGGAGGGGLLPPPPPPRRDPSAGASTGSSAAAVDPASEFPVAALTRVPNTLVRSGPCGLGLDGGGFLGGILSLIFGGGLGFFLFPSFFALQHTVPLGQEFVLGRMVQTVDIICGMHTPGQSFSFGFFLGGGGFRLLEEEEGLLLSDRFVMQQRPLPGHLTDRSISSHRSAKKPVTQVPLHRLPLLMPPLGLGRGFLVAFVGGFLRGTQLLIICFVSMIIKGNYLVVVVVVVVFLTGLLLDCPGTMSSGGGLPPKSCLATQHLRSDLHSPPMSRMASQNPERRSATHTPGHVSARGAIEGGKVEEGVNK